MIRLTRCQHALDEIVNIAEDETVAVHAICGWLLALQRLHLQTLHYERALRRGIIEYRPV